MKKPAYEHIDLIELWCANKRQVRWIIIFCLAKKCCQKDTKALRKPSVFFFFELTYSWLFYFRKISFCQ